MRTLQRGQAPPPWAPTPALPGSPEKVAVLRERFRLGQPLWHPQDAVPYVETRAEIDESEQEWSDVA
jgi:hypothetical protein